MHIDDRALENLILDSGLVSRDDLASLRALAKEKSAPLGGVAVTQGHITDDDLRRMTAHLLAVPFVDLKNRKIDFATLTLIPEPISRIHNIVAYEKKGDTLEVAMLEVGDLSTIDFLKRRGLTLLPRLTDRESMKWALLSYQRALKTEFGDTIHLESHNLPEVDLPDDPRAARIVDSLLKHALLQQASDLHIEPHDEHALIRYRIGGALRDAMLLPVRAGKAIIARLKALAGVEDSLGEGRFRIEADEGKVSFRLSVAPLASGERATLRLMREASAGFTLEGLGFSIDDVEEVYQALHGEPGLIVVAGPARSGKTTTLYTMLDLLNTPSLHLATIEDPIEYQLPRVSHFGVRPEIGFTFAHGLRTIARQDPDVIMVGDLSDIETAQLAARLASSGKRILTSLTASTPQEAFHNFITMTDSSLFTRALRLAIFQDTSSGRIRPGVIRGT